MNQPTFFLFLVQLLPITSSAAVAAAGQWHLLQPSIGISSMHMQLLYNDRVIIFDRTDFGKSNISLPDGKCRHNDKALRIDCTAHSVEYDVATNTFRPLMVQTDTWCSSGVVAPDGMLIQTGGYNDGDRAVRFFSPCEDGNCDWSETNNKGLAVRRWYATNQILPDGRAFIVGGRRQFSYEFYPKSDDVGSSGGPIDLPILRQTYDPEENNLYPFVHLNVDGNLFIFANNRAILFDYKRNSVARTYPVMPDGHPRNYPSSGSSVLLPLEASRPEAEVLVCGGAPRGSYIAARKNRTFVEALTTCGRIMITDRSPSWSMETMPGSRVMGDMLLLPNGKVVIINGAALGTAGWENAREPELTPVIYSPNSAPGARFKVQVSTTSTETPRPRMYHSSAILLRDARVLVGGSNPHVYYNFSGVEYPTDLSLEAYSPYYLDSALSMFRPKLIAPTSQMELGYGEQLTLRFTVECLSRTGRVSVTMVAPSFTTHSNSMNQRLLILDSWCAVKEDCSTYSVLATVPASGNYAPSGYYMVFVVNEGVPSDGIWVRIA